MSYSALHNVHQIYIDLVRDSEIYKYLTAIIMILQQLGWSYGYLRRMQSMQKTVQPTTFYVKSKEKYKCNFF